MIERGPDRRAGNKGPSDALSFLIGQSLSRVILQQEYIMATLQQLKDVVAEVRDLVIADNDSDAAAVAAMQETIDRLKAELAAGATQTDIEEVVTDLNSVKAKITPAIPVPQVPA